MAVYSPRASLFALISLIFILISYNLSSTLIFNSGNKQSTTKIQQTIVAKKRWRKKTMAQKKRWREKRWRKKKTTAQKKRWRKKNDGASQKASHFIPLSKIFPQLIKERLSFSLCVSKFQGKCYYVLQTTFHGKKKKEIFHQNCSI